MNTGSSIFVYVLALLTLVTACRIWLLARQASSARAGRERVPPAFAAAVPLEAHRKASDYTVANARVGIIDTVLEAALLAVLTWGGLLAIVDRAWRERGLEEVWLGLAVILSIYALTAVIGWPLSLYRTFVIEARFGFNRTTWRLYFADLIKGLLVGVALGVPLLAAILWLMQGATGAAGVEGFAGAVTPEDHSKLTGEYWWLIAWTLWAGFSLVLVWAYPALIAPLFNKFRPVEDATLKERIEALLNRCGFASRGVFVMDGSRRSSHGNAYFTGLGANKRIVLFDTLLERLTASEVEAVLAHELGHFKLKHIRRRFILSLTLGLAGLYLLGWLARQAWFYDAFGSASPSPHIALILFALWIPLFTFWFSPLSASRSRKHEFEADRFATEHSDPRELASALVKLYRDNATTLTPDRIYSAFFDSHPPAPVRIARLNAASGVSAAPSV